MSQRWSLFPFPQHVACLRVLLLAPSPLPGRDVSPLQGYPQQCVLPVPTNLYPWVKAAETKWSKIPCLRKQHSGRVRLEPRTSRSTQPHTPLHGLQVRLLITCVSYVSLEICDSCFNHLQFLLFSTFLMINVWQNKRLKREKNKPFIQCFHVIKKQ